MPVTEISFFLFLSTVYYFQHKDDMPACAELVTFRDTSADQILQTPGQHLYFRLWLGLTYNKALLIWFISLLVFFTAGRRKKNGTRRVPPTLCAVGLLIAA